ncbi:hypothetical protein [Bathymodiolus platifrons methanotrophic gill symbiont]|uniref:hypothetical protein n=1 Tax=Bathymodiolus platifrons methanotrophic gill symbiont TaxID=113268 RepID=UPI001C8D5BCA|nr:hypothetical protein [Bathymodiolus platifrons methanotrophic gill symbiont]
MAKKDHTAAERKIGFTAYNLYALGALFAGLYIYFLSVPWTLEYFISVPIERRST